MSRGVFPRMSALPGGRMPGAVQLAAQVVASLPGPSRTPRGARLYTRDLRDVVREVDVVPSSAQFLSWEGRVFQHWAGDKWREIEPVEVR